MGGAPSGLPTLDVYKEQKKKFQQNEKQLQQTKKKLLIKTQQKNQLHIKLIGTQKIRQYVLFKQCFSDFITRKNEYLKNYFRKIKINFFDQVQKIVQSNKKFQNQRIKSAVESLKSKYQEMYHSLILQQDYAIFIKKYNLIGFKQKIIEISKNIQQEFNNTSLDTNKKKDQHLNILKNKEKAYSSEQIQKLELRKQTLQKALAYIQDNRNIVEKQKYLLKILQDQDQCNKKIQQQLNKFQDIKNRLRNKFFDEIQKIKINFQANLVNCINKCKHNPSHKVNVIRKQIQIQTKLVTKTIEETQCIYQNCQYDHKQVITTIKKSIKVSQSEYADLDVETFVHIDMNKEKEMIVEKDLMKQTNRRVTEMDLKFKQIDLKVNKLSQNEKNVVFQIKSPLLNAAIQAGRQIQKNM